eukprot:1813263-Pyramimonas_sp.AAC.1
MGARAWGCMWLARRSCCQRRAPCAKNGRGSAGRARCRSRWLPRSSCKTCGAFVSQAGRLSVNRVAARGLLALAQLMGASRSWGAVQAL